MVALVVFLVNQSVALAQGPPSATLDEVAIRKTVDGDVETLNKVDAQGLATMRTQRLWPRNLDEQTQPLARQTNSFLPDGRMTSATNIITYVDDKTCTLQSVHRTVDGELVPSIDEVIITKE
jgi:hypothetical protein